MQRPSGPVLRAKQFPSLAVLAAAWLGLGCALPAWAAVSGSDRSRFGNSAITLGSAAPAEALTAMWLQFAVWCVGVTMASAPNT